MKELKIEKHLKRGEVYYIDAMRTCGSEQRPGRPAVIVSNDKNNISSDVVEVCYLTLKDKTPLPTHIKIKEGACYNSTILCEQVTSVDVSRIGDFVCRLTNEQLDELDNALIISLGLDECLIDLDSEDYDCDDKDAEIRHLKSELQLSNRRFEDAVTENQNLMIRLSEARTYEQMYNNLLDKLVKR